MAEVKEKERNYYNRLAAMVNDMTPNDIYATVQATPRPGTTLPQCAEDLLEELGSEELFRRVLAVGYMSWQKVEANWTKKQLNPYEPSSVRKVAEKFGVSSSRIMDLQRGEAITRKQTRMIKDAQGGEEGGRRGEKEEVQVEVKDSHSRGNNTTSQHLPAVTPQNWVPLGPPTLSPFRTTTISQGKHL